MSFTPSTNRIARVTKRKETIAANLASGKLTAEQAVKRTANADKRLTQPGGGRGGLLKAAKRVANAFGQGQALNQIVKTAKSSAGSENLGSTIRDALAAAKGAKAQPISQYDNKYLNDEQDQQGSGYMGMIENDWTGNDYSQSEPMQTGEPDPNYVPPTTFQGPGSSNSVARSAAENNALIDPMTGGYKQDAASQAAVGRLTASGSSRDVSSYTPTTVQNPKNKTTSPGVLDDADIIALNNYQINLEKKQATKGLNAKEAAQLDDYYRREEHYRSAERGNYEPEPDAERNKTALKIDPKTGLTTGIKPPVAKAASASAGRSASAKTPVPSGSTLDAGTGRVYVPGEKVPTKSMTPRVSKTTPYQAPAVMPRTDTGTKAPKSSNTGAKVTTKVTVKPDVDRSPNDPTRNKAGRTVAEQNRIDQATAKKYPKGPTATRLNNLAAAKAKAAAIPGAAARGATSGFTGTTGKTAKVVKAAAKVVNVPGVAYRTPQSTPYKAPAKPVGITNAYVSPASGPYRHSTTQTQPSPAPSRAALVGSMGVGGAPKKVVTARDLAAADAAAKKARKR